MSNVRWHAGLGDWEERLGTALVKSPPTTLVRATPPVTARPQTTLPPLGRQA